ncbi:CG14230 [Drosophila busckii]|uniref:CG14230 n=1 Tax=Drosophila busckii TaxID=30019 RepID=A0A0M3QZK2_DROBS|nr:probable RNA-binding protein CG14230 [Drosophila busckii]ALC49563.1 CG14230 [Drosophila busckii]
MESTRFFLADLPAHTTEQDLRQLFDDYGYVERVELKSKSNFVDADQTVAKLIAFVTLQTEDAQYCLNELNWQKLHGQKLRISLAKESFLDRLKRERDEGKQDDQTQADSEFNQNQSRLLAQSTQNKRRVFGEDEELNDDDISPELLITKKRAANSIHNGKIVIQQEHDVKPLHIIEHHSKKTAKSQLDSKAQIADMKRKESLNKMKQQHQQKKSLIQNALSSMDGGQAKRIKFSDAEEDDEPNAQQTKKQKQKQTKKNLFDEEDEDGEEEEQIVLPEYSGKKGERLVEMQSKQSLDPRFRITANFVGEEDDEGADEQQEQAAENGQDNERNWQLGILEQVIGRKIDTTLPQDTKASKNKKMLRFDPAKEDHQKLVRQKKSKDEDDKPLLSTTAVKENGAAAAAPVSQNAFYVVTDTLKESLKNRGEGFSLLDMFGSSHDETLAERESQLQKLSNEKILVNKSNKLGLGTVNPFSYDSSDSEDDETNNAKQPEAEENKAPADKKDKPNKKKPKIYMESFFIPKNDARLKEGAKFFKSSKAEVDSESYDVVKKRLKFLITKKIAKTLKNAPGKIVKKQNSAKNKNKNKK